MKRGLTPLLAESLLMGFGVGCGFILGERYLAAAGGELAGIVLGAIAASAAIAASRKAAYWTGYRDGHRDGRHNLFDRSQDH